MNDSAHSSILIALSLSLSLSARINDPSARIRHPQFAWGDLVPTRSVAIGFPGFLCLLSSVVGCLAEWVGGWVGEGVRE